MPLYGFKCNRCNKNWEAYRTPENLYKDYCCGVEAALEKGVEPKTMALESLNDGLTLQLIDFSGKS
jgi:hypothetical protein